MTSPPEEITVECPKCGHLYKDWFRGSVNLDLHDFDEKYVGQCSSATCPECQQKVTLDVLVVEDGVFKLGFRGAWLGNGGSRKCYRLTGNPVEAEPP